jgi:hypothetical protein
MAGSFNRRTRIFSQYCHGVGGSASAVITATDCPTIWEVMRDQYGWNFNGHVYIVWLWNRALTLSEMARIEDNYTQLFNLWKDSKRTFAAALSVVEYTAQFGSGTYLATGNQIVGSVNRVGVLSNGSYAIVGQSNSIRVERVASAANGSFSLVGNAMGGEVSRIAVASPGAYAVAGNAIGGEVSRIAVASPGAYTLLGSGLAGGVSRIAVASPGAYTIAGNAIGGQVSRVAVASPGAFSIVASDLAGGVSRQTSVAGGVFTSIGSDLSATVQRIAMHSHGVFTVVGVSGNFPVDVGETPAAVSGTSRAFTVHSAGESVSCDVRSSIWTHEVREPGQAAQGEYQ